jgi:hypothetical protein
LVTLKHPVEALANSFGYDSRRSVQSVRACHEQVTDVSVLFSALRKRCLLHHSFGDGVTAVFLSGETHCAALELRIVSVLGSGSDIRSLRIA